MRVRGAHDRGMAVRAHVGLRVWVKVGLGAAAAKYVPDEADDEADSQEAKGDGEAKN